MATTNISKKTVDLTFISVVAALYAALCIFLAPISYGPLQFRFADILQPLVLKHKRFIYAIALGTFFANLNSPLGVLDWGLMPFVSLAGGFLAHYLSKKVRPSIAMISYAILIATGVGFILHQVAQIPFILGFVEVAVTVYLANFAGIYVIDYLHRSLLGRGIDITK